MMDSRLEDWYNNYSNTDWVGADPDYEIMATRFNSVSVPQGSTITSATFTITADNYNSNATSFDGIVQAEATDNASAPGSGNLPTGMTLTSAGATYTPSTYNNGDQLAM